LKAWTTTKLDWIREQKHVSLCIREEKTCLAFIREETDHTCKFEEKTTIWNLISSGCQCREEVPPSPRRQTKRYQATVQIDHVSRYIYIKKTIIGLNSKRQV